MSATCTRCAADITRPSRPAAGSPGRRKRTRYCRGRMVFKICRDDGRAVVVIARIEDQAHRVPNPFGGLHGAQFVEHEDVRFEYRT